MLDLKQITATMADHQSEEGLSAFAVDTGSTLLKEVLMEGRPKEDLMRFITDLFVYAESIHTSLSIRLGEGLESPLLPMHVIFIPDGEVGSTRFASIMRFIHDHLVAAHHQDPAYQSAQTVLTNIPLYRHQKPQWVAVLASTKETLTTKFPDRHHPIIAMIKEPHDETTNAVFNSLGLPGDRFRIFTKQTAADWEAQISASLNYLLASLES